MEILMALVTIIAVIAIVAVGGGLIAFLIHMVVGVFDKDRTTNTSSDLLDYSQYKQLENGVADEKDYDFDAINEAKVEEEKKLAETAPEVDNDDVFKLLEDEEDLTPEEMEKKIVETKAAKEAAPVEEVVTETTTTTTTETVEPVEEKPAETEEDDFELDNLLDEISSETEDEVKAEQTNEVKMDDELESYSIDEYLNNAQNEEETEETEEEPEEEIVETTTTTVEEVAPAANDEEVEKLKAQVAELNKKLSETQSSNTTTVITMDMTEEECLNRLAVLEERLKTAKKDYRINLKEYRPLKKIMNELERNQVKLRRKDAVVAKQKVALYGVNNYVDIDKEKAEKLANELELLDGLRLSVQHCEEVIAANKDRYPILEHTNNILEEQIANLESDIEATQIALQKIRDKQGKGGKK